MRENTRRGAPVVAASVATVLALTMPSVATATPATEEVATRPRVGVDAIAFEADIPEPDQAMLTRRFHEGIQRAGFEAEPGANPRVTTTVARDQGDYRVQVALVRGDTPLVSVEDTCELCGIEELGDLLAAMGGQLRRQHDLVAQPAVVRIETQPPGAQVRIDGEPVGQTPLEVTVQSGPHEIAVSKPGHRTERRRVDARAGTRDHYSFVLRRGIRAWLPWTFMAAGLVGTAAGATLIALDGDEIQSDCNADTAGNCQFVRDTLAGGITLTALGVGLAATGVALAIKWRAPRKTRARARLQLEIAGAGLRGRF